MAAATTALVAIIVTVTTTAATLVAVLVALAMAMTVTIASGTLDLLELAGKHAYQRRSHSPIERPISAMKPLVCLRV